MSLRRDERGQMTSAGTKALGLILGLAILALMAAFLIPVAVDEIEGDTTVSFTQDNRTVQEVNGALDSNATFINSTNATIVLTVDNGSSITNTVDVGTETGYSFDRGTVTVGVESTDATADTVTANYTYPRDFAFSDASRSLWGILSLMIVLAVVLAALGIVMSRTDMGM